MNTVFIEKRSSEEIAKSYRNIALIYTALQISLLFWGVLDNGKLPVTLILNLVMFIAFTVVCTELILRNKEEPIYGRAFNELGLKRKLYIYTLGASAVLMPIIEIFTNLPLIVYGTIYAVIMIAYFIYLFNTIEKIESKIEELKKEDEEVMFNELFEDFDHIEESEPKTLIDEKKAEVLSVLNEIKEKLETSNDFVSIEKRRLINEVYASDVERKMNVLSRMSETQKAKEQKRVLHYFDQVIKEAKELI